MKTNNLSIYELMLLKCIKAKPYLDFNVENVFLFLACLSWPFYFLQSGYPQLFALFLICFCLAAVIKQSHIYLSIIKTKYFSYILLLFLVYTYLVNGFYATEFGSSKPLIYSLYLTLCFGVAIVFGACLLTKPEVRKTLAYGIAISLVIQGILAMTIPEDICNRQTLFFNNPNQLAFYSVLSLCFLVFQFREIELNRHLFLLALTSALILILITHSRAAMLSVGILIAIQITTGDKVVRGMLIIAIFGGLAFAAAKLNSTDLSCLTESAMSGKEMLKTQKGGAQCEDPDSLLCKLTLVLKGRGYDRIWEFPEYLIFGAGEGVDREYSTIWKSQIELHSSVGTLIFCYGVVGTCFTLILLVMLLKRRGVAVLLIIMPLLVYSMLHNTLRQPFFWLYLTLLVFPVIRVLADERKDNTSNL